MSLPTKNVAIYTRKKPDYYYHTNDQAIIYSLLS